MALDSTTAITFFGVQAWDEGTEENFVRIGNSTAVRTLLCAWEDRITVIEQVRGGGTEVGSVYYYSPLAFYPDAPFLAFDSIHVEGLPGEDGLTVGPNGMVGYKYARLRITYKSLDYFDGVTTGTTSLDFATQVVGLPRSVPTYQFPDGTPLSPQDSPSLRVGIVTIVQTRKNLAELPTALVQGLAGCVNSIAFLGGNPGTVLFDGAHADRRLDHPRRRELGHDVQISLSADRMEQFASAQFYCQQFDIGWHISAGDAHFQRQHALSDGGPHAAFGLELL